jgi:hypothetical protein
MEDWLKRWFDNGFHSINSQPKEENWEKIEQKLNDWPKHWYQSNAAFDGISPDPVAWSTINFQLQQKKSERLAPLVLAFRLLALILIILLPLSFSDQLLFKQSTNTKLQIMSSSEKQMNNQFIEDESNANNKSEGRITQNSLKELSYTEYFLNDTVDRLGNHLYQDNYEQKGYFTTSAQNIKTKQNDLLFGSDGMILPIKSLEPIDLHPDKLTCISLNSQDQIEKEKKIYLGPLTRYSITTLLNPITSQALDNQSTIQGSLGHSVSFGFKSIYKINKLNAINLNLIINDIKSQRYYDLNNSAVTHKRMDVRYMTIETNYRRQIWKPSFNHRFSLNWGIGAFISFRSSITEFLNDQEIHNLRAGFRKYDFGLTTNINGSYRLNSYWSLEASIFHQNGLLNIFSGMDKIPANFFRTYTTSTGLSLTVLYSF